MVNGRIVPDSVRPGPTESITEDHDAPGAFRLLAWDGKPYPLSVAYLHKLSGSQTKQLRYFKKNLAEALSELVTVGAVAAFEILGDLVHVRTVPSKSQQKHLAARRPPNRRRK